MKRRLWLLLFVALGGVAAWLAMPAPRAESVPLPSATLDGKSLPLEGRAACLGAAEDAARAWLEQPVAVVVEGTRGPRTREQLGARLDAVHLEALVGQVVDPRSALRRTHAREQPGTPLALAVPYVVDVPAALGALLQMKDELDVAPLDARWLFDFTGPHLPDGWSAVLPAPAVDPGTIVRVHG